MKRVVVSYNIIYNISKRRSLEICTVAVSCSVAISAIKETAYFLIAMILIIVEILII